MNEIFIGNNLNFISLKDQVFDEIIQLLGTCQRPIIELQLKTQTENDVFTSNLITLRDLNEQKISRLLAEHEISHYAITSTEHHSYFILYRIVSGGKHRKVCCMRCNKSMTQNNLVRHMSTCNSDGSFCCICKTTFIDFSNQELRQHIAECGVVEYACLRCKKSFTTARARSAHICTRIADPNESVQSAVNGLFKMIEITPSTNTWDFENVLDTEKQHILNILAQQLNHLKAFKFFLSVKLGMHKLIHEADISLTNFRTSSSIVLQTTDLEQIISDHMNMLKDKIDTFLRGGSGFIVDHVKVIHLNITKYDPLHAGQWLPLPKALQRTSGLLNIKCSDNKCFMWNCIAVSHPYPYNDEFKNEAAYYQQFEHEIDQSGITWPMSLDQICKFEKLNDAYRVNVIAWEEGEGFYPLHVSNTNNEVAVLMLMICGAMRRHFVLVTDLNRLLGRQHSHFFCIRCFHGFYSPQALTNHEITCKNFPSQVLSFPEDDYLYFKSFRKTVYLPCYIVLDLESILPHAADNESHNRTTVMQDHIICGFAYKIVTDFSSFQKPVQVYRGSDAAEQLVIRLHEEYEFLYDLLFADEPMEPLTDAQQQEMLDARKCHICDLEFEPDDLKVADHCHYRGHYIGPSHATCNMERRTDKKLRVITHNFSSYDCHLFIKELCKHEDDLWHVHIIPKTLEKYTSVSTSKFRFIDSYQHMPASLEKLVSNLVSSGDLNYLRDYVKADHNNEEAKFQMLCRKQVSR
jgi:hypothetical protein